MSLIRRASGRRALHLGDFELAWLLLPPGETDQIGPDEQGHEVADGIAVYRTTVVRPSWPGERSCRRYVYFVKGEAVSALHVSDRTASMGVVVNVWTDPAHRRRGLASKLFKRAKQDYVQITHSADQSPDGALWSRSLGRAARGVAYDPTWPEKCPEILRRRAAGETLKAIGESMGLGKERVRQIEFLCKRSGRRNDEIDKAAMVAEARALLAETFPDMGVNPGACLYAAWAIIHTAAKYDIKLLLYGGSTYWRCMDDARDDGVSAQFFGYGWDSGPNTVVLGRHALQGLTASNAQRLAAGQMPEMHVWAGSDGGREVVDITTRHWPEQTRTIIGRPWLAPPPPDFFWGAQDDLPEGASYQPHADATRVALAMLEGP